MSLIRRVRLIWTPAQIRPLPTAYRFLNHPALSQSIDNKDKAQDTAPIELPPPPVESGHSETLPQDKSSEETTHERISQVQAIEEKPTSESPLTSSPSDIHLPGPEPKDQSIRVGPSSSEELVKLLRSWTDNTKTRVHERSTEWTNTAITRFSQLGRELNQATGYGEIEELKKSVGEQETRIQEARNNARDAKLAYEKATAQRAQSQREVNDLLSRKSSWADSDVSRFTTLVRQDHLFEQEEVRAKNAAAKAEDTVEREFSALMRSILNRYHEEQVWSDKIRSASTYGSLAVLGLNVLIFLMATIFVEPWKRRKLATTFEKKVDEMDAKNSVVIGEAMTALHERLDRQQEALIQLALAAADAAPVLREVPVPEEKEPAPVLEPDVPEAVSPPMPVPSTWSWSSWKSKFLQQDMQHVLMTVSSAAFMGGAVAGWVLREVRR